MLIRTTALSSRGVFMIMYPLTMRLKNPHWKTHTHRNRLQRQDYDLVGVNVEVWAPLVYVYECHVQSRDLKSLDKHTKRDRFVCVAVLCKACVDSMSLLLCASDFVILLLFCQNNFTLCSFSNKGKIPSMLPSAATVTLYFSLLFILKLGTHGTPRVIFIRFQIWG